MRALLLLLVLCAAACDLGSEDCNDRDRDDACTGSFKCEGASSTFACERATQTCVKKPGSAASVTIPGANPRRCPSRSEALGVAGCQTGAGISSGNLPKCSGDSEDGITVTCHI